MRSAAPYAMVAVTTAVLAVGAGGCSIKSDNADKVAGKQVFVQKCGSCHVLARAGTKGVTGPDLDAAFARSRVDGLGQSGIQGVVEKQIAYPSRPGSEGTGVMPANLVNGKKAADVAAYVAQVVGQARQGHGPAGHCRRRRDVDQARRREGRHADDPGRPGRAAALRRTPRPRRRPARSTIEMPNKSGVEHNIAIKGLGEGPIVKNGVSSFKADLKAGTYTYFCAGPGPRGGGHEGHAHRQVGRAGGSAAAAPSEPLPSRRLPRAPHPRTLTPTTWQSRAADAAG